MRTAVITGGSSGLGRAIIMCMAQETPRWSIHDWSLHPVESEWKNVESTSVDVRSAGSVSLAARAIEKRKLRIDESATIDVLINCAGINGNDFLEDVEEDEFDDIMDTNVKGIFNCSKELLTSLKGGTILNIVSNASHIPMTGSLAYNASKGAALMATKQLARELMPRHGITVFSISPNKLRGTAMSQQIEDNVCRVRGWTREEARAYQAKALITGEETNPVDLAEFITWLLSTKERHKWFAGCDIPYGL